MEGRKCIILQRVNEIIDELHINNLNRMLPSQRIFRKLRNEMYPFIPYTNRAGCGLRNWEHTASILREGPEAVSSNKSNVK